MVVSAAPSGEGDAGLVASVAPSVRVRSGFEGLFGCQEGEEVEEGERGDVGEGGLTVSGF